MLKSMNKVSYADRIKIERKSRKSQKYWHNVRRTRITASIAHNVVRTCRRGKNVTGFLKNHMLSRNIRSEALSQGIKNEEAALREYSKIVGEKFYKCGIFIDSELNYLSATPDAINEFKTVIVEIKCPFKHRLEKPESAGYLENNKLKKNHMYYTQVQLQMHVTKIHLCDFVVWTTRGIFIQSIAYDEVFVNENLKYIDKYFNKVFSPFYFKYTQKYLF